MIATCNDTTTFNIPLIDDIIEDLVLFSQQLLLPRVIKATTTDTDKDNNNESNLREIDVSCSVVEECGVVAEESDATTTTTMMVDIENNTAQINDSDVVMNDEEYEKWFYINNAGLAVVLPFVVSISY